MNRTINTAAVEAATERVRVWLLGLGTLTLAQVDDLAPQIARSALSAALPHLGAAPSAPACAGCGLAQREHQPGYAASRCAYTPAAAPSATREAVARAIFEAGAAGAAVEFGLDGPVPWSSLDADDVERMCAQADALLARFTITPRTDR